MEFWNIQTFDELNGLSEQFICFAIHSGNNINTDKSVWKKLFYFFNSFYENLAGTDKIDDSIDYSGELYNYYSHYLYRQLEEKPEGTRVATFHSLEDEMPRNYYEVGSEFDNLLKFWIKVKAWRMEMELNKKIVNR